MMKRKEKSCTLLVKMQIGATTMENRMEDLQKSKIQASNWLFAFHVCSIYSRDHARVTDLEEF